MIRNIELPRNSYFMTDQEFSSNENDYNILNSCLNCMDINKIILEMEMLYHKYSTFLAFEINKNYELQTFFLNNHPNDKESKIIEKLHDIFNIYNDKEIKIINMFSPLNLKTREERFDIYERIINTFITDTFKDSYIYGIQKLKKTDTTPIDDHIIVMGQNIKCFSLTMPEYDKNFFNLLTSSHLFEDSDLRTRIIKFEQFFDQYSADSIFFHHHIYLPVYYKKDNQIYNFSNHKKTKIAKKYKSYNLIEVKYHLKNYMDVMNGIGVHFDNLQLEEFLAELNAEKSKSHLMDTMILDNQRYKKINRL